MRRLEATTVAALAAFLLLVQAGRALASPDLALITLQVDGMMKSESGAT